MTAKQMIKKIEEAGISTANIKITGKREIEVKSESKAHKIMRILPGVGGFKCGYGAWVIRDGYKVNELVFNNMD